MDAALPLWRQKLRDSRRAWLSYDAVPAGLRAWAWIWTALLAVMLAALFTVLGVLFKYRGETLPELSRWAFWFGKNLVVCGTIAALTHVLFDLLGPWAKRRMPAWSRRQQTLFFAGVPMVGMLVGWPLGLALAGVDVLGWFGSPIGARIAAGSLLLSLVIMAVLHGLFALNARQLEADRRATEAQLKLLQAQMEPHFLFNTLANVLSLMEHDALVARRTLAAFTDYLRATLGGMRRALAPLEAELALAEAYLRVVEVRMAERLRWHIDAEASARAALLPPLLLQPLVENAIEHGLAPQLAGGELAIRARCEGPALVVEVRDNGTGAQGTAPARTNGQGMALSNIRQRLAAHYGGEASLELTALEPGTMARLRVPLRPQAEGADRCAAGDRAA
jgi:hypothetical protein